MRNQRLGAKHGSYISEDLDWTNNFEKKNWVVGSESSSLHDEVFAAVFLTDPNLYISNLPRKSPDVFQCPGSFESGPSIMSDIFLKKWWDVGPSLTTVLFAKMIHVDPKLSPFGTFPLH